MVSRLGELLASTPGLDVAAVVSTDGLSIASSRPTTGEEDVLSAVSAARLSVGDPVVRECRRESLKQVWARATADALGNVIRREAFTQ
jgi:predicted regulator of Ras-like GTPase activity (Roadblock/LC7/MglB family)